MREALEHCEKLTREFICGNYYRVDFPKMLLKVIDTALSAPPRNCDVGTPREQELRMNEWCCDGNMHCRCGDDSCSIYNVETNCVFDWLQMPYEGGAK